MSIRVSLLYTAAASTLVAASSASAENVTNWATWTLPSSYDLPFVGEGSASWGGIADYAPGASGSVIDPQTGQTVNFILSGEVAKFSSDYGWWGASEYITDVSPNTPVLGETSYQIGQTGFTSPEYQAHSLTFDAPVTNLVMNLSSVGSPSIQGGFTFSQPFIILDQTTGPAAFTESGDGVTGGYQLTGYEAGGQIQFLGTYQTISWVTAPPEAASYFTIGLTTPDNPQAGETVTVYDLFTADTGFTAPTSFGTFDTGGGTGGGDAPVDLSDNRSVLERVLSDLNGVQMVPVTGTFVNIAENIGITTPDATALLNAIDGSVTNTLSGVTDATASVGDSVVAIDQVTVDIGNVSTTVLGAVNTGTTSLGVNSDYNQAVARTSSAVSGKVLQLGGMSDQAALVLNVASNATSVVGSVTNSFTALNGSVGNIGTTVLGAVNTGSISSGINSITNGVVAGVVGG